MKLIASLLLAELAFGITPLLADKSSKINVEVWSIKDKISASSIRLIEAGTKRETGVFRAGEATDIPYGVYDLIVQAAGFANFQERIRIFQPEIDRRVVLQLANMPDASLNGVVQPAPQSSDMWVRLVSLRSNNTPSLEARVRNGGSFSFAGIDGGDYLLLVMDGLKVVHTEQLPAVRGEQTIHVVLFQDHEH